MHDSLILKALDFHPNVNIASQSTQQPTPLQAPILLKLSRPTRIPLAFSSASSAADSA